MGEEKKFPNWFKDIARNAIPMNAPGYLKIERPIGKQKGYSLDDLITELSGSVSMAFNALSDEARKIITSLQDFLEKFKRDRYILRKREKAYIRSQRNNQYVKRYKHGRTQRTRIKKENK